MKKKTVKCWTVVDSEGFGWHWDYGKTLMPSVFMNLSMAESEASAENAKWGVKTTAVPATITYTLPS